MKLGVAHLELRRPLGRLMAGLPTTAKGPSINWGKKKSPSTGLGAKQTLYLLKLKVANFDDWPYSFQSRLFFERIDK